MPLLLSLHRLTYCSLSLPLHPGPDCQTPVAETMSCHGRTGKRAFSTAAPTESMEPAADLTEKNTIDICLSPRTENASFQQ